MNKEKNVHSKRCTQIFTANSFQIATKWKQAKCSLIAERVKRVKSTHTIEDHSAIKSNQEMTHSTP